MDDDLIDFFENDRDFHHARRAGEGHRTCPECGANLSGHPGPETPDAAAATPTTKPLLLLDVDGVINDIEMVIHLGMLDPADRAREMERLGVDVIRSHGYQIVIPRYMPELIQELAARTEIVWLTTWRLNANHEIAAHLGVGPFDALDPNGTDRTMEWKPAAAHPVVADAVAAGRSVIWIEDFNGAIPDIDGVTYVDTAARGVLRWSDLPIHLLE